MRVFERFNQHGKDVCPICKTNECKQTVLVIVDGTESGNVIEAIQVHLDCIDLRQKFIGVGDEEINLLYHRIEKEK